MELDRISETCPYAAFTARYLELKIEPNEQNSTFINQNLR